MNITPHIQDEAIALIFRKAGKEDVAAYSYLASKLWPDECPDELDEEFLGLAEDANSAIFLAIEDRIPIGFVHCQVRTDYVEGANASPVGYIEGIFVIESHRKKGVARRLLSECENWARSKGIKEMGSDCEIANEDSIGFHRKHGFIETNRIVCFIKNIGGHQK